MRHLIAMLFSLSACASAASTEPECRQDPDRAKRAFHLRLDGAHVPLTLRFTGCASYASEPGSEESWYSTTDGRAGIAVYLRDGEPARVNYFALCGEPGRLCESAHFGSSDRQNLFAAGLTNAAVEFAHPNGPVRYKSSVALIPLPLEP